jgi:hypothetical protein
MKKFIQITAIFSFLFAFAAVSAFAQSSREFKAEIPFDFSVGENTYQSGSYTIKINRQSSGGLMFTLENSEGKPLEMLVVTNAGTASEGKPQLVFNRYGDRRFLAQINSENLDINFRVSKAEKIAAKQSTKDSINAVLLKK